MRSVTELTVRKARQMLTAWAAGHDAVDSFRDQVVRAAIDRIAGALPAMEQDPRSGVCGHCASVRAAHRRQGPARCPRFRHG